MPGAGMTNFTRNSVIMAKAGIYDLRLHHDDVVHAGAAVLAGLRAHRPRPAPASRPARSWPTFLADLEQRAAKFVASRERAQARERDRRTRLD